MKNFIRWLRATYHWARQMPTTRHYWCAAAVVVASILILGAFDWTEKAFRLVGMFLQLGGVLTVVWGILKTRADFGQLTVWSQFQSWAKTFPPFHPRTVTVSMNGSFSGLHGEIHAYSTHGPAADQTIEGRLTHLDAIVKKLEVAQGSTHIAVLQAEKKAQQALDTHARQLSGQIDAVARKIEATATGGVHVSAVGVVWLFVGTVFGGAAPELHYLLTR